MAIDQFHDEWAPFGRPLFADPDVRALSRVGVLDVGSNSVRMVVFDGAARSPAYFFNEKILCGLGAGLGQTGRLNPEGKVRAHSAIRRFKRLADAMELHNFTAVATAAIRDAEDGPEFAARVLDETGIRLHVIDGLEEARLSAQGVLLGWPGASGVMCDIGGNSMELARIHEGEVGKRVTSQLGPLKLASLELGKSAMKKHIKGIVDELVSEIGKGPERLFLVGGSWRAIARLDMHRRGYPLHVLHEYRMTPKQLGETIKWIDSIDLDVVRKEVSTSAARMNLVPIAAQVLKHLVRGLGPREIAVSAYGIREGLLYEQMPQKLRQRDPLIEACRFMERKDARIPGFGKSLHSFIHPLFAGWRPQDFRIVRAACLMHDVAWRSHPDYRHEVTFEAATRANLGGLTHQERVFLGMALLHRYKSSRDDCHFQDMFSILSEYDQFRAEVLGKAIRFGAMFAVDKPHEQAELTWRPKKHELTLRINPGAADLFGEVAQARFQSLADALGATTKVSVREVGKRGHLFASETPPPVQDVD